MTQKVIFPNKFWKSGSAGWCDYTSDEKKNLKQFLESLEGLQFEEAWGTITLLNGEFIPVDKEGQESSNWEKIILEWDSPVQQKKLYKIFFCYGELVAVASTKQEVVAMFANDDWHEVTIDDVEEVLDYMVMGPSRIVGGHVE